ncbi:hypothetical protein L3X38_011871 [Prunus dulcis]|uniref:DUF4218 domain-containing protein n=1 Tax=Prunus dulcis TaxID=3755 RepID=A0AAD4WIK1_PRUDU|nr:hypothetical protein L3X38_011871 [Prunus dulcis]
MFFELPYWSKLKLRHNLDVMHVEKNAFNTLVGTILDIEGKTNDTIKAGLDLESMGIRRGLWMNRDSDKARRDLAFFSMKPNDKKEFLKFVSSVKFPDEYASNITCCVNVEGTDIFQLRHDIVQVLCKFEMIFPPASFTSMMHVMVHLPEEALLAGPVNYHWMYPIERLLGELKKSVRNRAKPEGSIIEAWVQYESLTFCGMYLKDPALSHFTLFLLELSPPLAQPLPHWILDRSATTVIPRSFPTVIVEPAALISSVFTDCAPPSFSLLRRPNPTLEMSDLIRRHRAVTTTQSLEHPALPTSAATVPALMDYLAVGPVGSQAPASSASSVAQPVSARRRHRPASTTDTTSTDASGSQLVI